MSKIKKYINSMLFFIRNYGKKRGRLVRTTFRVPSTPEGDYFIALMRKYLNRDTFTCRVKGRCSNANKLRRQMKRRGEYYRKDPIRLSDSDWKAVYLDTKNDAIHSWLLHDVITEMRDDIKRTSLAVNDRLILKNLSVKLDNILKDKYSGVI